jgi:hypothetical protein
MSTFSIGAGTPAMATDRTLLSSHPRFSVQGTFVCRRLGRYEEKRKKLRNKLQFLMDGNKAK